MDNIKKLWIDGYLLDISDIDTIKQRLANYYNKDEVDGFVLSLENAIEQKTTIEEVNEVLKDYVTKTGLADTLKAYLTTEELINRYPVLSYGTHRVELVPWDGDTVVAQVSGTNWVIE